MKSAPILGSPPAVVARKEDDEVAVDYELSDEDGEEQSADGSGYPTSSENPHIAQFR